MYYKVFLGEDNTPFYVKCDSFRIFVSIVSRKTNITVSDVVEPEDLPKGDLVHVVS